MLGHVNWVYFSPLVAEKIFLLENGSFSHVVADVSRLTYVTASYREQWKSVAAL